MRETIDRQEGDEHSGRDDFARPKTSHRRLSSAVVLSVLAALAAEGTAQAHDVCRHGEPPFVGLSDAPENTEQFVLSDAVYGTKRNHWGQVLPGYEGRGITLPPRVIKKLVDATRRLQKKLIDAGMDSSQAARIRIIVKDGYRPHVATDFMAAYAAQYEPRTAPAYVPSPDSVSGHNNGNTVDFTIGILLGDGTVKEIWMGSIYDEFSRTANHGNPGKSLDREKDDPFSYGQRGFLELAGFSPLQLRNLLKAVMVELGAKPLGSEWWHYSFGGGPCYDVLNRRPFERQLR